MRYTTGGRHCAGEPTTAIAERQRVCLLHHCRRLPRGKPEIYLKAALLRRLMFFRQETDQTSRRRIAFRKQTDKGNGRDFFALAIAVNRNTFAKASDLVCPNVKAALIVLVVVLSLKNFELLSWVCTRARSA